MRVLSIAPLAALLCATLPAQAQLVAPSSYYVGLAGGPTRININCAGGACDQTGTGWKVYGGLRFPNDTGVEVMYQDLGLVSGDNLSRVGLSPGKVEGHLAGVAGTWSPAIGPKVVANLKVGVAVSMTRLSGLYNGVYGREDRTTFPHVWLGAGLGYKLTDHIEMRAEYDYTRVAYRNTGFKQTVDGGAFTLGGAYVF